MQIRIPKICLVSSEPVILLPLHRASSIGMASSEQLRDQMATTLCFQKIRKISWVLGRVLSFIQLLGGIKATNQAGPSCRQGPLLQEDDRKVESPRLYLHLGHIWPAFVASLAEVIKGDWIGPERRFLLGCSSRRRGTGVRTMAWGAQYGLHGDGY